MEINIHKIALEIIRSKVWFNAYKLTNKKNKTWGYDYYLVYGESPRHTISISKEEYEILTQALKGLRV